MLRCTPHNLKAEWEAWQSYAEGYLGQSYREDVQSYHGTGYRTDRFPQEEEAENHALEWIGLMQPEAVSGVPHFRITSTFESGPQADDAERVQYATNTWAREVKLNELCERLFVDFAFRLSASMILRAPSPGEYEFEDDPQQPEALRLSLPDFGFDITAGEMPRTRWRGHRFYRDLEDCISEGEEDESSGWNLDLLEDLGTKDRYRPDDSRWENRQAPDRGEIELIEIHVPEFELPLDAAARRRYNIPKGAKTWRQAGFNGTVFTLCFDFDQDDDWGEDEDPKGDVRSLEWVREPRPYFGPREGPYVVSGGHYVPDEAYPLAPIPSVKQQYQYLNDLTRSMQESAREWKRIILAGQGDPKLAHIIQDGEHHNVFTCNLEDLPKMVMQLELAGTSDEQIRSTAMARDLLDRISGLIDAQRGNVTGEATATEVLGALQSSAKRIRGLLGRFRRDTILELGKRAAWFFYHDNQMVQPVGAGAYEKFRQPGMAPQQPLAVVGGNQDGSVPQGWDQLDMEIAYYEITDETEDLQQARAAAFDELLFNYLGAIQQFGYMCDFESVVNQRQRMHPNMPDLAAHIDFEVGAEVSAAMVGAQLEAGKPQAQGPNQNRLNGGAKPTTGGGPGWRVGAQPQSRGAQMARPMTLGGQTSSQASGGPSKPAKAASPKQIAKVGGKA